MRHHSWHIRVVIALTFGFILENSAALGGFDEGKAAAERGDYATALKEWQPLADRGDAAAEHGLGVLYTNGWGLPQDYWAAEKWFRKAADQGFAKAQYSLGIMYHKGLGVRQDFAEAMRWYRLAA
jgi:TPR repeat protein